MVQNQIIFKQPQILISLMVSIIGVFSVRVPAQAAEQVILKYSILRESVSVEELSTLANTGEASKFLRNYLKLANK